MSWLDHVPEKTLTLRAKRGLDILLAGGGMVALSPVLAATTAAVWVGHGFPPFFVQSRPGIRGRLFEIIKLRTMSNQRGPDGALLPDAERLTRLGKFLRASSLDELPELLNVLRGDMSLVGPRPLLVEYLDRYSERQARRHEMPPGITGWAQVNGRNAISWEEKLELDVWYVDHHSLVLDLEVLARTLLTVVARSGISAEGEATMPVFMGSAGERASG